MSVLVYTESEEGKFKKIAFEAVSFAKGIANILGTSVIAVSINGNQTDQLGKYGASKVLSVSSDKLENFNASAYADVIAQAAEKEAANIVVISSSANCKYLAPLLAINMEAGYVPNAIELPSSVAPFKIQSNVFSNKAFANSEITTEKKLIGLAKNAFGVVENETSPIQENFSPVISEDDLHTKVTSLEKSNDKISIADADIVVSGGRGLKGPENWGMIEELAETLGAATACSKPVSDLGWRPHSEHVGQTGKPVSSNLYIAIGISGAIQHLAGVNSSKVKVVINSDSEAPFFKAADYGIVGDAFEYVPQLIEKLKEFKSNNA
jgi:electron transfer flavoprotein alpha subunit